jgi:hypothetical protein
MTHAFLAVLCMLFVTTAARAQVDCSDADNLCTGDPCVIGDVVVDAPCVVDFSPRALVIGGTVTCATCGTLSLSPPPRSTFPGG